MARVLTAQQAFDRCAEMDLDMDLTKAKVKAFARRLLVAAIFDEGDVSEVDRMCRDRDWCAEDVLSEVRAMLMSCL